MSEKSIRLSSGYSIPLLGYGTWQVEPGECEQAVANAIRVGYRHIDTATLYENEAEVGRAVAASGLPREDFFITTKVWNTERGYDKTLRSFEGSLKRLGMDYVDLFLIHWPANPFQFDNWKQLNADTWKALERLSDEGLVRSIGVSNFMPRHLKPLLSVANIRPAVNQIELHPGWVQRDCLDFCFEEGIAVESWSPLANGAVFGIDLLKNLSAKYGKSIAQVVLQWVISLGVIPLSRSVKPERMAENYACDTFTLSPEDIAAISALPPCGKCRNPDLVPY